MSGKPTTHCPKGHLYDEKNIYWATQMKRGKPQKNKQCRRCIHIRSNKSRKNKRVREHFVKEFGLEKGMELFKNWRDKQ